MRRYRFLAAQLERKPCFGVSLSSRDQSFSNFYILFNDTMCHTTRNSFCESRRACTYETCVLIYVYAVHAGFERQLGQFSGCLKSCRNLVYGGRIYFDS